MYCTQNMILRELKRMSAACHDAHISTLKIENKIAFQSKANHPQTGYTDMLFCCCDLELDPMTLIYKFNLDTCIPKIIFLGQGFQKLE